MTFHDSYHRSHRLNQLHQLLMFGFSVGRVFGIVVRVHIVLVLMLAISFVSEFYRSYELWQGVWTGLLSSVISTLVLYFSILAHELGHCYGTYLVGGRNHSILLWPLGGMAVSEGAERTPRTELVVIALGPAVSLALAAAAALLLQLVPAATASYFAFFARHLLRWILVVNLGLFLFNMLMPILPMDGARLLRAALALRYPAERITQLLAQVGMWAAAVLFFANLFFLTKPEGVPLANEFSAIVTLIAVFGFFHCAQTLEVLPFTRVYAVERWAYAYQRTIINPWVSPRFVHAWKQWRQRLPRVVIKPAAPKDRKPAVVVPLSRVEQLREQMRDAIREEDFERAARLRDEIRRLSAGEQEKTDCA